MKNGWLWDPQARDFEPWSGFLERGEPKVERYYSMFQCFPLYRLCQDLTIRVGGEWWGTYDREEVQQTGQQMVELAKARIESIRKNGYPSAGIALICQAISNRYYPKTQSDRRALSISQRWPYHDWRWEEYCRKWDAEAVRQLLDVSVEELKKLQERTALDACVIDPLEHWYSVIRFVSVDQRARHASRPDAVALPSLAGLPLAQAQRLLQEHGLTLGRLAQVHSPEYAKGEVIAQDPEAGALTRRGSPVALLLSLGQPEEPAAILTPPGQSNRNILGGEGSPMKSP